MEAMIKREIPETLVD